ncbi:hypothetical protein CPB84DRAFT_1833074 [Gymnopilus junonius]|uniref:Uncharacterized protein n=1 Tax=Gymnopilus junonius TaxID=109634 RepID=A0A9P5P1I2_GYMJU|nr:hypothetical protein CPB84DRAFT_1833074 [Gymnopilus junonius]
MIAGLSKAVTLYLAPVLALDSNFALLTVVPSTALLVEAGSSQAIDGPSVFIGVLGSCSRPNNAAGLTCTSASLSSQYNFAVLPSNAPDNLLSAPTASTPVFVAIAIAFSVLFFIAFTLISFRHKMGSKIAALLDRPLLPRASAWIGVFGFILGITSFLILRMWFGKAVQDFNNSIAAQGHQGPELIAAIGNAFTMVWVAYAFYAVPIISSLTKLNVTSAKQI